MQINIPTNFARVLEARANRLNQSTAELTRFTGWDSLVDNELTEARSRHKDKFLGGEELLQAIDDDAAVEVANRKAV